MGEVISDGEIEPFQNQQGLAQRAFQRPVGGEGPGGGLSLPRQLKLLEMNEKDRLFRPGMTVLDLGLRRVAGPRWRAS